MSRTIIKQKEDSIGRPAWDCPMCGGLMTIKYVFNPHDEVCDSIVQCRSCKEILIREFMNPHYYNSSKQTVKEGENNV